MKQKRLFLFLTILPFLTLTPLNALASQNCSVTSDNDFIRFFDHTRRWVRVNPGTFEVFSGPKYELIIDFNNRSDSVLKAAIFTKKVLGEVCNTTDPNKLSFISKDGNSRIDVQKNREGLSAEFKGKKYYFSAENRVEI